MYVVGNSSVDFIADARKIQQDYINWSSSNTDLSEPQPTATVVTVPASHPSSAAASANPHTAAAVSNRPSAGPVVVRIPPPATNAVPTTVRIPPPSAGAGRPSAEPMVPVIAPPSPFGSDYFSPEASPVSSTLRSVITRPQSTSIVFRASPRATGDSGQAGVGTARTATSSGGSSRMYAARRTDE